MDINIIHLSLPLVFTSFIAFAVVFFILVAGRKYKLIPNYNNVVPVFEIVTALEKICPLSTSNKWKLFAVEHGCHRCWSQSLSLPFLKKNINLYGSATIISASPMSICSLVSDVSKWPEWNPFFNSQYISKSFHDKQLRRDHYMEADQIVSIVRETNKIQSHVFMYRFQEYSENKVGWILFWNPKMLEFLYFLIQPVKNKNEGSLCLLTHIMGTESKLFGSAVSLVSQRLRNIQDLVSFSTLCVVPSMCISSVQSNVENPASQNKLQTSQINIQEDSFFSLSSFRARKREIRNTIFVLVPFKQPLYDLWKRDVEFKLAVKNMDSTTSEKKSQLIGLKEPLPKSQENGHQKISLRRTTSDVGAKSNSLHFTSKNSHSSDVSKDISLSKKKINLGRKENSLSKQNLDTASEDSETKNYSVSKKAFSQSKLLSLSETAVNKLGNRNSSYKFIKDSSNLEDKLHDISENVEDKLLAMDEQSNKEMFNSSISDFEIVETCEFTENRIAGFLTQGNYGAAELQAEALLASQFIDGMNSGNFQTIGGWMFHSYHKGLCTLTKTTCNKFIRICSFLCQVEIPVAPKDVWRFVKNPQFRFICDESVKCVEVLEKISNSQKLIHTYHEVGGFIRKELMDFCLLQTEREELNKYYSCFYSIEFDKCPFMKSVTRGTLRPSGWIVEKVDKDVNRSIVTFMMQVLISSPDSLFIQELSTMVPQSVHNLKNYITSKPT